MMKAADSGHADDLGIYGRTILGPAAIRRVAEGGVDPLAVVVVDVFAEKALEVPLVQHDHMIE
jgi:hypothetical protein